MRRLCDLELLICPICCHGPRLGLCSLAIGCCFSVRSFQICQPLRKIGWSLMTKDLEACYQRHISMSPLDRPNHDFAAPESLKQPRWQRLERRVFTMVMKAIPESCGEKLVADRRLDVYGVLTYLYTTYCPSRVAEKQHLLRA